MNQVINKCLCGCGQMTRLTKNRYLQGHSRKGRKSSIEHILKFRISVKGRKPNKGCFQPGHKNLYKGKGLSPRDIEGNEWTAFRKKILERDSYECQHCGAKENLHVHHWAPRSIYPGLNLCKENVSTLCSACHKAYHSAHGNRMILIKFDIPDLKVHFPEIGSKQFCEESILDAIL